MRKRGLFLILLGAGLIFGCKDAAPEEEKIMIEESPIPEEQIIENDETVDAIQSDPELSTFGTALSTWNVENKLERMPSYTVFAPDNEAYADIYQLHGQNLVETSSDEITPFHVVPLEINREYLYNGLEVADTMRLQTLQGEELRFTAGEDGLILIGGTGETAQITDSITTGPNRIYVIDAVLLPRAVETTAVVE